MTEFCPKHLRETHSWSAALTDATTAASLHMKQLRSNPQGMYKTKADKIHERRFGMGKTNECKPVTNLF